jgi:hypothetical protein
MQIAQQMHTHPDDRLRDLFLAYFMPVVQRYLAALDRTLPEVPFQEIAARFYFVVGALIHTLTWERKSKVFEKANLFSYKIQDLAERLVHFSMAGMCMPYPGVRGKGDES